jgi:ribosomal protein S12 methylthiotransferase RimO
VTLGCTRNEVDSEELAGRLAAGGWRLTDSADGDAADAADVVLVNTCGFVDSAKKDSIDTVLAAAEGAGKVVAVGCLAERYGRELADALPEADAVLGFDSYADIAARLDDIAAGRTIGAHTPRDRRTLLPVAPAQRPTAAEHVAVPGHAWLPAGTTGSSRTRLDDSPSPYLKLASGCDRRCSFCAIPSFRGSFVSRPPQHVLAEARWFADQGVRELVLVSENSTSYGKDFGDLRALESLLPQLGEIEGIERIRLSYLQPAELRPSLLDAIVTSAGVAPYFDLSFQHASAPVLRRMKRFGSTQTFLELLARIRARSPDAGVRSNVIVGFPGETEDDLAELETFLTRARLDVVGVFGYSDEDGTQAASFDDKLDVDEISDRVSRVSALAEELMAQRAEERVGQPVDVLVEQDGEEILGRASHQGPDTDGVTTLAPRAGAPPRRGELVRAVVTGSEGVDLYAETFDSPGARSW